ncbi:MAG: hypothetical protein OQL17_00765 [Sedimenticola sp.]|nr:hypothetical protein [Sedimenticola sp.]MCW8948482.1 hypothetical protein [Sedimenticola sp.]MCW8975940.1 hypothetical protein [Sedimenticola sp.]
MNRVIQPLSENFLYCSPEAMCRDLYKQYRPTGKSERDQQKKVAGVHHGKSKTD